MSINKLNYESFAIDYLEGNLPETLLAEMEALLLENPEIRKEVLGLKAVVLQPDREIVFTGKESLKKSVPHAVNKSRTGLILRLSLAAAILAGGLIICKVWMPSVKTQEKLPVVKQQTEQRADIPNEPENPVIQELVRENEDQNAFNNPVQEVKKPHAEISVPKLESEPPIAKQSHKDKAMPDPTGSPDIPQIIVETVKIPENEEIAENEKPVLKAIHEKTVPKSSEPIAMEPESISVEIAVSHPDKDNYDHAIQEEGLAETTEEDPEQLKAPLDDEEILASIDESNDENIKDTNSKLRSKKKRRVFFNNLKEKFSKSNLTNALIPEAYSTGSDD